MAVARSTYDDSAGSTPELVADLRRAQATAYNQEDFAACFAADDRLAIADPAYAQSYVHQMQKTLHALARTTPDLRFLQIGGMDGKRFDPIYAFVKHYRWSGVILEPLPDLFAALTQNYADAPQVTLLNAALMDFDGTREITRVSREPRRVPIRRGSRLGGRPGLLPSGPQRVGRRRHRCGPARGPAAAHGARDGILPHASLGGGAMRAGPHRPAADRCRGMRTGHSAAGHRRGLHAAHHAAGALGVAGRRARCAADDPARRWL